MQRLSTLASEHVSTLREELDTFGIHLIKARPANHDRGELAKSACSALGRMMQAKQRPILIPIRNAS